MDNMGAELQPIAVAISAASFAVGALALLLSAYNIYEQRRSGEVTTLFDIWDRYEQYVSGLTSAAKDGNPTGATLAFANAANYVENLCTIYNRKAASSLILYNIKSMVSDFVVVGDHMLSAMGLNYQDFTLSLGLSEDSYSETREFIRNHRKLLSCKGFNISGSIYERLNGKGDA